VYRFERWDLTSAYKQGAVIVEGEAINGAVVVDKHNKKPVSLKETVRSLGDCHSIDIHHSVSEYTDPEAVGCSRAL
jgi:hypothetical protein